MHPKLAYFQKVHDEAVESINRFLQPYIHEPQIDGLVLWMMETDANPYAYLPENWANLTGDAEGFAGLLHCIHHAVYDDGDITFVSVNGEPRIVFYHKSDEGFQEVVLSKQEQQIEKDREKYGISIRYQIEILNIKPNEFGPLYDSFQAKNIKRCFITDAIGNGNTEAIAKHYRKYQCWNEEWVAEAETKIN